MPKRSIVVYIEQALYDRFLKAKSLRERLNPPGWKSISSYARHLLEVGLNLEEKELEKGEVKKAPAK